MRRRRRFTDDGTMYRPYAIRSTRCGKLVYPSKKIAQEKAKASTKSSGELIEAYHCFACHGYHIGHPPGSRAIDGAA